MLVERMRKFCRYNRSNDPGANVLMERMREFCRYVRSNPWSVMLAGDGLETEAFRGRGVGKCARGEDV